MKQYRVRVTGTDPLPCEVVWTDDTAAIRHGVLARHLTEAEAGVIAFALNAVAGGNPLAELGWPESIPTTPAYVRRTYDGPTQGVA